MKGGGASGWFLYARILRVVADGPCTAMDAAGCTGTCLPTMRLILRRMHAQRLIHIHSWVAIGSQNMVVANYALGESVDALRHWTRRRGEKRTGSPALPKPLKPRAEMTAFATIVRALREGECTAADLALHCGINVSFGYQLLRRMRALRIVHVAEWSRQMYGGCPAAMFAFAIDAPDKARPTALDRKEIDRRRNTATVKRNEQLRTLKALSSNSSVFNQAA